jgi:hypothetical protein
VAGWRLGIVPVTWLVAVEEGVYAGGDHRGHFGVIVQGRAVVEVFGGNEQHQVPGGACGVIDGELAPVGDFA